MLKVTSRFLWTQKEREALCSTHTVIPQRFPFAVTSCPPILCLEDVDFTLRVLLVPEVFTLSAESKPLVSWREEGLLPSCNVNFSLLQSGAAHTDELQIPTKLGRENRALSRTR